jgi:hypothetical protein
MKVFFIIIIFLAGCGGMSTGDLLEGGFIHASNEAVRLIYPLNYSVSSSADYFKWEEKTGVHSYIVTFSRYSGMEPVEYEAEVTTPEIVFTESNSFEKGRTYYWRVKTVYTGMKSYTSSTYVFDILNEDGIYVDADSSADHESGNKSAPYRTIQSGIDAAVYYGLSHVYAAGGSYQETIVKGEGISLHGGRSSETFIFSKDINTVLSTDSDFIIKCLDDAPPEFTDDSVIEGFIFEHRNKTGLNACLYNAGASPVIRNNIFRIGPEGSMSGIINNSSSAVIINNIIEVDVLNTSVIVAVRNEGGSPEIRNNFISVKSSSPYNISMATISSSYSSPLITNNIINMELTGNTLRTYAVIQNNSSGIISCNTIRMNSGGDKYGLYLYDSSSPDITDNILFSGGGGVSHGIYEAEPVNEPSLLLLNSDPASLTNNIIFGFNVSLYRGTDVQGTVYNMTDSTNTTNEIDWAPQAPTLVSGSPSGNLTLRAVPAEDYTAVFNSGFDMNLPAGWAIRAEGIADRNSSGAWDHGDTGADASLCGLEY